MCREIFAELIHAFAQGGKRVTLRRFYLDGCNTKCKNTTFQDYCKINFTPFQDYQSDKFTSFHDY